MQNPVLEAKKATSPSDESLGLVQPQLDKQLVFHKAIHLNSACLITGEPQAFLNCIFLVELGQKHSSTQLPNPPFQDTILKKSFFFGAEEELAHLVNGTYYGASTPGKAAHSWPTSLREL